MKLGYVIGALNAGGSERQLSQLAAGMHQRNHQVQVFCYDGPGIFDDHVREAGITLHIGRAQTRMAKVQMLRSWMRDYAPDIVHGFLKRSSSAAILANLPTRRHRIVATDFSTATYRPLQPALWGSLVLFHGADAIVTETRTNFKSLSRLGPTLRSKLHIIANGVDLARFRVAHSRPVSRTPSFGEPFRLLAVGSACRVKNPVNLIAALGLLRSRNTRPFELTWAGRARSDGPGIGTAAYDSALKLVKELHLEPQVKFVGHVTDIEQTYASHDALVHVSLQEGLPNVVVEAMASGLPLVTSRVSDLPQIVKEAQNGFLCNAQDPQSIAEALDKMLLVTASQYATMADRSRRYAEDHFALERFFGEFEQLYREIMERRR